MLSSALKVLWKDNVSTKYRMSPIGVKGAEGGVILLSR